VGKGPPARLPTNLLLILVMTACSTGSPAPSNAARPSASPPLIVEFSADNPSDLTVGPDQAIWFTGHGPNYIGRLGAGGDVRLFATPAIGDKRSGIVTGSDGNLWFSEFEGGKIGRLTPAGVFTMYALPVPAAVTAPAKGPDGNIWFGEAQTNRVGRITPAGVITEYPIPTPASDPRYITLGPDGAMWFAENGGNRIGRVSMEGRIQEFPLPRADSGPTGIATGGDGNLWFTEQTGNRIGRITTTGGVTEFSVPTLASAPYAIAAAPDQVDLFERRLHLRGREAGVAGDHAQVVAAGQVGVEGRRLDQGADRSQAGAAARRVAGDDGPAGPA